MTKGIIHTEKGEMFVEFYERENPGSEAYFVKLANSGLYDGLPFQRVIPGFVLQDVHWELVQVAQATPSNARLREENNTMTVAYFRWLIAEKTLVVHNSSSAATVKTRHIWMVYTPVSVAL